MEQTKHVIKVKFGFSEGLNFGCGFFIAGALFLIVAAAFALLGMAFLGLSL